MKYLGGSFSVYPGESKNYRDNYDRIFKKEEKTIIPTITKDEPVKIPEPPIELIKIKKEGKNKRIKKDKSKK